MPTYEFPFICKAARRSRCPETGKAIHKGDLCGYYPAEKLQYHQTSTHFGEIAVFYAVDSDFIMSEEVV